MNGSNESIRSNSEVKELLIEDYRYWSDSFWKNEQTGETRVNIFIAIVTLVSGALVELITRTNSLPREVLRFIVIVSLLSLLLLGFVTLARIIKRNESTDRCKLKLDSIRQIFKDYFDTEHILVGYNFIIPPDSDKKKKDKKYKEKLHNKNNNLKLLSKKYREDIGLRKFGGLTHFLAVINSILLGGIVGVFLYRIPVQNTSEKVEFIINSIYVYGLIVLVFVLGLCLQIVYTSYRELQTKKNLQKDKHTHAGGVVYYKKGNIVEYWLVESTKDPDEMVLPKGHIKHGEGHIEAALREVKEEAGIVGKVVCILDTIEYETKKEKVKAKFYLMEKLYVVPVKEHRDAKPFTYKNAMKELKHPENKYILEAAQKEIVRRSSLLVK